MWERGLWHDWSGDSSSISVLRVLLYLNCYWIGATDSVSLDDQMGKDWLILSITL